jgi:hypothetical protein
MTLSIMSLGILILRILTLSVITTLQHWTSKSGACFIKHFKAIIFPHLNKLECLPLLFTSTLVKYLQERPEPIRVEPTLGLHSNGGLLIGLSNIRQGWKLMAVANTLAYYEMATIMAVKSLIVQTPNRQNYT